MEYNKTMFGEGIKVYNHGTAAGGQTLYDFTIGSKNANLSAAYQSQAIKNNGPLPDDLFYWLASEDSPYNRMSFIYRTGTSPNFEYQKIDTPENKKPVPLVLWAGPTKINPNTYDVDIENGTNFATYGNNSRLIFNSPTFNMQTSQTPLWELNYGHSSSVYKNGVYSSLPFILDFDYNNFILKIRVGQGQSFVDLADYVNDSSHYIDSIAVELFTGDVSTGNSRLQRQPRTDENGNTIILMDAQDDGYYVVTDFDYKIPTVYAENYQYPTYRKLARLGTSSTHVLFSGINVTSNLLNATPYFFIEDDKWELVNGSYRLKKSGNNIYSEDDLNYIRKLIAYLGFWFTDGGIYKDEEHSYTLNRVNSLLGDYANTYSDEYIIPNHVYQAEIKEGITTGNFTELRIAKDNDQSKWGKDWRQKNGYDGRTPGGGDKPKPTPDPNPIQLQTPGFSLAVDNGSVCYTIDKAEWRRIWDDIYGGSKKNWKQLIEGLSLYGANPLNAILNYRWYPFEIAGTTQQPIRLGATTVKPESHTYLIINNTSSALISSNIAEFWIGENSNFMWTKKTKCRIFLPFYGYYELPMTQVMAKTVGIQFQYNLPDDTGVWAIYFDNHIYDYVECSPFIEIPITGDNSLQIAAAKAQRNLSIALTVGTAVATAGIGFAAAAPGIASIGAAAAESAWAYGGSSVAAGIANIGPLMADNLLTVGQIGAAVGGAGALAGGGTKAANTVMQSALQIGNLSTNVPVHSSGSDTTFLHLPMQPFIEFFTNNLIEDYSESQYKLKVGIACDMWKATSAMPDDTLLKTAGIADMDTSGMTLAEVQELNQILQSGFYK